jgi:hypothetical protein
MAGFFVWGMLLINLTPSLGSCRVTTITRRPAAVWDWNVRRPEA